MSQLSLLYRETHGVAINAQMTEKGVWGWLSDIQRVLMATERPLMALAREGSPSCPLGPGGPSGPFLPTEG